MDIGIALLMTQHDFNTIDLAVKVEELGFESLWILQVFRGARHRIERDRARRIGAGG